MKEFYTVKEIAELFGINLNTAYNLLRNKHLEGCRIGGSWRVHKSEIEKVIQR